MKHPNRSSSGGADNYETPEEILHHHFNQAICSAAGPGYLLRASENLAIQAEEADDRMTAETLRELSEAIYKISVQRRAAIQNPLIAPDFLPTTSGIRHCLALVLAIESVERARLNTGDHLQTIGRARNVLAGMSYAYRLKRVRETEVQYEIPANPADSIPDITEHTHDQLVDLQLRFRPIGFS